MVNQGGLIEQIVMDTPNTMVIPGRTIQLMCQYNLSPYQVAFDAGGGGKQIADRLHEQGHRVCVVGFGESAEAGQAYKNRRAELYGKLREYLNPNREQGVFALPPDGYQLRQELAVLPLQYDSEGRMFLPPKDHSAAGPHQGPSLRQLLGRSPDRADSLALAVWVLDRWKGSGDPSSHQMAYDDSPLTPEEIAAMPDDLREIYEAYDEIYEDERERRYERELW